MRFSLALIFSLLFAVGLVAFGFTFFQVRTERKALKNQLEMRISKAAKEVTETYANMIRQRNFKNFEVATDTIKKHYNLQGISVYFNPDSILSDSYSSRFINYSLMYIQQSLSADSSVGKYTKTSEGKIFQFIEPLNKGGISETALVFYSDGKEIDEVIGKIWLRNFVRWFIQALIVALVAAFVIRWGIFSPINKIIDWIKALRAGNLEQLKQQPPAKFLAPLHKEIGNIAMAMSEAKAIAQEEARLRTNAESVWTPERLKVEIGNLLQKRKMIVVSNREPYMHIHEGKGIKCIIPASGMITAMEPILKACGGLWIAAGTGDADKDTVDKRDKVMVPPEEPTYSLRRLWLTKEEENHYYYGFSNEGIWPLCHIAHTRPVFRKMDWHFYRKVNEDFAKAVLEEIGDDKQPFILIQDFHFALLPELIKKARPKAKVAIFWHIPWPNPESFGICPWQKEILQGLLGADLIGFHTQYHCNHFLETVNNAIESIVVRENSSVKMGARTTFVKPFPISIAFTLRDYDNISPKTETSQLLLRYGISAKYIGIGVDRIDYTKGIVEKFLAIEQFLNKNPNYIGSFTFVQIGAPSRTLIKSYSDTIMAVENEANRINLRFRSKTWKPILLLKQHHSHEEIYPFYTSSDFCMVSSLHDGMNLVAKEYVASRNQNDGVLILSRFTGASQELHGAIIINPYDTDGSSDAIKAALEMPKEEQYQRMKQMRQKIIGYNIYSWASDLLRTMSAINS